MSTDQDVTSDRPARKRRRWPFVLGAIAAFFVAVFYLGGGFYFSSLVYSDALQYKSYDPASVQTGILNDVSIDAGAKTGEVTMTRDTEFADEAKFDKVEVGLKTSGGILIVGPATKVDGPKVTRPVIDVVGTAPSTGAKFGLVRDIWTTPEEAALTSTDVTYKTDKGEFPAWEIVADPASTKWAVLSHGKGASRSEMLRMAKMLAAKKINSLVITYSNDQGAPKIDDGMVHFGAIEWKDLEGAVKYVQSKSPAPTKILLGGISHGGAVTWGFMKNSPLAKDISAIVLDAPASSLRDVIDYAADYRTMPGGLPIPESLQTVAIAVTGQRYGIDYDLIDYTDMPDVVKAPLLLFQGDEDQTVPQGVNDRFAEQHKDKTTYVVVPGAQHVLAWNIDPKGYESKLDAFLAKNGFTG